MTLDVYRGRKTTTQLSLSYDINPFKCAGVGGGGGGGGLHLMKGALFNV